jgi:hypothetical protein
MNPSPILPQQQIIQVNGKASVDTIQLAPNSSVLVMDTSAPIVWMCVSDGVGKVTATPYDITIHKEAPPIDMTTIEERITRLERVIEEVQNGKSYASITESKQNIADTKSGQKHVANN